MFKIVRNSSYKSPSDDEEITDPSRIARLLKSLSRRYSPISVRIPGQKGRYTSCIVSVDKPFVLLDELMPSSGHEILLSEKKVKVTGKIEGVDIQFSTRLKRVDEQKEMLTYYFELPDSLLYQQRRLSYRVRIPISKQLHVLIDDGDKYLVQGELHDLSHGGAGKIIPEGQTTIKPGEFYECAIELPCGEWLFCTVEMRYMKNIRSRKKQFIGARFIDLSPKQTRLIARCISALELDEVRKRAEY